MLRAVRGWHFGHAQLTPVNPFKSSVPLTGSVALIDLGHQKRETGYFYKANVSDV